jgi:predicted PurR-regulated permease PerM
VPTLYFAKPVLAPLAVALLLSVVFEPLVRRIESLGRGRLRFGRVGSVVLVVVTVSALLVALGAVVVYQAGEIGDNLPKYRQAIETKIQEPLARLESAVRQVSDMAAPAVETPAAKVEVVEQETALGRLLRAWSGSVFAFLANACIVVVLLAFILIESQDLRDRLLRLAGRGNLRLASTTLRETGERVTRYLRAVVMLNAGHGLVVGIGLTLLGLPAGFVFGLLTAMLRFVPYVGPWTAALAPVLLALTAFDDWLPALEVAVFLASVELVSNNFVEPWLYGSRVGLSPFAVILSAIFWTWLWGPVGLVLATPLSVCIAVLGRHVPGLLPLSILLGDENALQPYERMYERISAQDPDAALEVFEEAAREEPLAAWGRVALPALRLLERDRRAGTLDPADWSTTEDVFRQILAGDGGEPEPAVDAPEAVLCVPAASGADEIIVAALAGELARRGITARVCAHLLTSELVSEVSRAAAPLVCISAVDPQGASLRHLMKRLQRVPPSAFFVVGCWGESKERLALLHQRLWPEAPLLFVSEFGEALDSIAARSRLEPTGRAAGPAGDGLAYAPASGASRS